MSDVTPNVFVLILGCSVVVIISFWWKFVRHVEYQTDSHSRLISHAKAAMAVLLVVAFFLIFFQLKEFVRLDVASKVMIILPQYTAATKEKILLVVNLGLPFVPAVIFGYTTAILYNSRRVR